VPLGALGRLHWFRCRDCGMTFARAGRSKRPPGAPSTVTRATESPTSPSSSRGGNHDAYPARHRPARFAARLTREVISVRRELAEKVVRNYCLAKGVAVALNPIPVADLLAAIATDAPSGSYFLGKVVSPPHAQATDADARRQLREISTRLTMK